MAPNISVVNVSNKKETTSICSKSGREHLNIYLIAIHWHNRNEQKAFYEINVNESTEICLRNRESKIQKKKNKKNTREM